jgi:hypothetical protein
MSMAANGTNVSVMLRQQPKQHPIRNKNHSDLIKVTLTSISSHFPNKNSKLAKLHREK